MQTLFCIVCFSKKEIEFVLYITKYVVGFVLNKVYSLLHAHAFAIVKLQVL